MSMFNRNKKADAAEQGAPSQDENGFKAPKAPKPIKPVKVKETKLPRAPGEPTPLQAQVTRLQERIRSAAAVGRSKLQSRHGEPGANSGFDRGTVTGYRPPNLMAASKPGGLVGSKFYFVENDEELEQVPNGSRVILWGQSVIASMTEASGLEDMVEQPSRKLSGNPLSMSKDAGRLRIWIPPAVLKIAASKRLKVNLAIDYAIQFGQKQKTNCMVVTGMLGDGRGTQIDVLIFSDGKLVHFEQRSLAPKGSSYYQDGVQSVIGNFFNREGYEYKPKTIYLHDSVTNGLEFRGPIARIGDEIYAKSISTPLRYGFRIGSVLDVGAPVGILAASIAASAWMLWGDLEAYRSSVRQFRLSVAGVEADYAKGQEAVSLLQLQRQYLEVPVPQADGVKRLISLLTGVASEQQGYVRQVSFTVTPDPIDPAVAAAAAPGVPAPLKKEDFTVSISAPAASDKSGLEQAQVIAESVAKTTGAEVRLIAQKQEPDPNNEFLIYRVFDLAGRFPPPAEPGV